MANYKGDLRDDLASDNDAVIQSLSHEVMLIEEQLLDLEDETDADSRRAVIMLKRDKKELLDEIRDLRRQGR